MKHDLESLLEQISVSSFLLHEHVLSLQVSKLYILSLHSLYKFHVSCFVFSHFNSLPPASLSLLLHFNCDFHGYRTRYRSTCIKCPSGCSAINLLLATPIIWPRIMIPVIFPLTVCNSLTTTDCKKKPKLYFLSLNLISEELFFCLSLILLVLSLP